MSGKQKPDATEAWDAFKHAIDRAAETFHCDWFRMQDQAVRATFVLDAAYSRLRGVPATAVGVVRAAIALAEASLPNSGKGRKACDNRLDGFTHAIVQLARESYGSPEWAEDDLREIGRKVAVAHLGAQDILEVGPSDFQNLARNPKLEQLVYFITCGDAGPIKIGIASDPQGRLSGLQTGHFEKLTLVAVTRGGRDTELAYHRQFAAHRLHGEWFERCPEIEAEIARLNEVAA